MKRIAEKLETRRGRYEPQEARVVRTFPNVRTQEISWANQSGTHKKAHVTRMRPIASAGDTYARFRRLGDVLQQVVGHAFQLDEPLRVEGSGWSSSRIGVPSKLSLSLAAHDVMEQVPESWLSSAYQADLAARDRVPMLISGAMEIGRINHDLSLRDLALQTSGASDGQTLAGASTTGTHGAALHVGALHDTFSAIHLMVGPKQAVLLQPSSKPLKKSAAASLTSWLGFSTEVISDDGLFRAALVGLGSFGLVLNLVVEVEPLYFLTEMVQPVREAVWRAALSGKGSWKPSGRSSLADHFELVLMPYLDQGVEEPQAWVRSMVKSPYADQLDVETRGETCPWGTRDLAAVFDDGGADFVAEMTRGSLRGRIQERLVSVYGAKKNVRRALPGVMFGAIRVPSGNEQSMDLLVEASDAERAVGVVISQLEAQVKEGRQFWGALGVRFIGGSLATLAPNSKSPTCSIQLPAIRNSDTTKIYDACGHALRRAGVPFGCHWAQYLTQTKTTLRTYWPASVRDDWIRARKRLLPTEKARRVFASPILGPAGLG